MSLLIKCSRYFAYLVLFHYVVLTIFEIIDEEVKSSSRNNIKVSKLDPEKEDALSKEPKKDLENIRTQMITMKDDVTSALKLNDGNTSTNLRKHQNKGILESKPIKSKNIVKNDRNREKDEVLVTKPKLEFVHITKTGGTAITRQAIYFGIKWGICHWKKMEEWGSPCDNIDIYIPKQNNDDWFSEDSMPVKYRKSSEPWHTPPHWFKEHPFSNAKTFTVVRNPYDRSISEYYSKFGGYVGPDKENAEVFNNWMQKRLSVKLRQAHFLPQYLYVFDKEGKKVIDHVLRYENLIDDFRELMNKYSLDVVLEERVEKRNNLMTIANLTRTTIEMINTRFANDFRLFDYPMLQ